MRCDFNFRAGACPNPPTHWYEATRGTVPLCTEHVNRLRSCCSYCAQQPDKFIRPMNGQE